MFRVYILLEIICIINCLHYLYAKKISYKFPQIIPSVLLIVCQMIIFELEYVYHMNYNLSWFMIPMIAVYTIIEFGKDIKKLITSNLLCILCICILELFAGLFLTIFRAKNLSRDIQAIVVNSAILFLLWVMRHFLEKVFCFFLNKNQIIVVIGIIYIGYLFLALVLYKNVGKLSVESSLMLLIFGSGICVLAYCWQKDKIAMATIIKNQDAHQIYDESYKELLKDVQKNQHDFNNHLQAIIGMCYTSKDYDELVKNQMEYTNQLIEKDVDYKLLNIKWPLVAGFVHNKINEALQKGIIIKHHVDIVQKVERIPEYVMIEILGIILDNAIEAVENHNDPIIYLKIDQNQEKFRIIVSNPVDELKMNEIGALFEKGYSSKEGHCGIGLGKLKEYSSQYQFQCIVKMLMFHGKKHFQVFIGI